MVAIHTESLIAASNEFQDTVANTYSHYWKLGKIAEPGRAPMTDEEKQKKAEREKQGKELLHSYETKPLTDQDRRDRMEVIQNIYGTVDFLTQNTLRAEYKEHQEALGIATDPPRSPGFFSRFFLSGNEFTLRIKLSFFFILPLVGFAFGAKHLDVVYVDEVERMILGGGFFVLVSLILYRFGR